jgi:hypothetical protein
MIGRWCCCRKRINGHLLLLDSDERPVAVLEGEEEEDDAFAPPPAEAEGTRKRAVLMQMRARDPARYEDAILRPQLEPFTSAFGTFAIQLTPARFVHDPKTGYMTFLVTDCSTFTMLAWVDRVNYTFLEALLENYYEIVFAAEPEVTNNVNLALARYEATVMKQ